MTHKKCPASRTLAQEPQMARELQVEDPCSRSTLLSLFDLSFDRLNYANSL